MQQYTKVLVRILLNLKSYYKNAAAVSYLMVTGVSSKIVVTLSRNAEIKAAKVHKIVIRGHVFHLQLRTPASQKKKKGNFFVNICALSLRLYKESSQFSSYK